MLRLYSIKMITMKRVYIPLVFAAMLIVSSATAQYRQNDELHASHGSFDNERRSPNRSAGTDLDESKITIEWSAPSARGRVLFGRLIPPGRVWRTGANEASVIHFDDAVLIEGEELPAGNYALFTIGSPEEFTFIFNSVSQQWGSFSHDVDKDALRVTVETLTGEHQEEMLFSFRNSTADETDVYLNWGTISTSFNVRLAPGD